MYEPRQEDHPHAIDFAHFFLRNALIMSAYCIKELGDDCANVRDGWPSLDVTTSIVDFQTAVNLLDALSPVNV